MRSGANGQAAKPSLMMTLRLRPKPTVSVREHRASVEAIRKGDPQAALERPWSARDGAVWPRAIRPCLFRLSSGWSIFSNAR